MQLDNNSLIMQWNVDINGNPVSKHIAREVQQVSPTHNLIQLTQIPDNYYPVRIVTEDNVELIEVKYKNDMAENTFYVEYGVGLVYFHESLSGKMILANYYGRGVMLISDSRIFHRDGDTIADTWDNIIERSQDALDLIEHAGGLAGAIEIIDKKVEEGNKVADRLEDFITETQFYGYTITLSREAFVVKADDNGEVGKTEVSSVYTDVIVYQGAKQIIPTLTVSNEQGCTFKVEGQRVTLTSIDINFIKVNAILNIDCGDNLVAQRVLEVTKVFDGVSQYQVSMSNPFFSFQANSNGEIEEDQTVTCELEVSKANIDYTNYQIQVQNAPQGLNYSIGADSVVFTGIKGRLLPSSGTCLVVVTIDGQAFNKSFSWNKMRQGQDAKSLTLVGSQIIRYETPDFSDIPSQTKSTVSAKISGLSGTPKWSFYNGVEWTVLENETSTDLTFVHNDELIWGNRKEVTIKCELEDYSDELTIVKLANGTSGTDAITVILTNESHTVSIDDSGLVATSEIEKARTTVLAYKGTQNVMPTITKGKCEGCDVEIKQDVIQLISLDNSFTSSTAELLINVDGVNVTKVWTISKSKQGQQGQDGANGSSYILNVTGGVRSVTYSQINQDPRPATSSTFVGSLYENGVEIVDDVSWYWVANGHFEGNSILSVFTPTIKNLFDESSTDNNIMVTATYNGQTISQTIPLSVTKDASGIDWVQEWDSTKTEVRGNVILTPKIFAGHYDQENDLVTGVAIGQDVLNNGRSIGIVGYQNNEVSVLLDVDGSFQIGNPFKENSPGLYYSQGDFKLKATEISIEGVKLPTSGEIDDKINGIVNSAKEEINNSLSSIISQVTDLDSYVNNSLKDGLIDNAERNRLEMLYEAMNQEVLGIYAQFDSIISNPFLTNEVVIDSLVLAMEDYTTKFNLVTTSLNKILESEVVLGEDVEAFNNAIADFRDSSSNLNQWIVKALSAIAEGQANELITQAKEEIKAEIDDVNNALTDLEDTLNGDFKAGLITSINLAKLENQLQQLAKEKADIDGQYNIIINNAKLSNTVKQELLKAKSDYDIAHDILVAKINTTIADNLMTEEELREINALIQTYTEKLGIYSAKAQEANADIALQSAQGAVEALDQEAIFNKLTNNGEKQGLYLKDGKIYLNSEFQNTRNFKAVRDDGTETLKIDSEGNASGRFKTFYLVGDDTNIPTKDYVDDEIGKVALGNVNIVLSNEVQVIATSNSRVPLSNQTFTTTVKVYMGTKEITDFTIGTITNANGITVSTNQITKAVTFSVKTDTALGLDSGAFTIPVIFNETTYNKDWSWAVSKQGYNGSDGNDGTDGVNAEHVIVNGEQLFKYSNNFTGTPTPSNITLTVTKVNTTATGKWQYKNASGTWTDWKVGEVVQTGTTLLVSPTSYNLASEKIMSIRYIIGSIYDEITIVKVTDGTNGTNGTNGKDAQYVLLNGEQVFKYTNNFSGTPTPSSITLTATTFNISNPTRVWDFKRAGEIEWTRITSATNNNSETFVLDANNTTIFNTNDVKSVTIRCMVGSVYDEITIVKVSDGTNGTNGKDGINGVDGADGVSTHFYVRYSINANGNPMTELPSTNSKYMGVCSTTSETAPTDYTAYTWTLVKGADGEKGSAGAKGEDGRSSYLHVKYSDDGKTFTANNGETIGNYIGTYVDYTEADSNVFGDYTWKKFVGEDGTDGVDGKDAYTVVLSNESHTFPSDSNGNIATALSTTTTVIGFKGTTSVTPTIGTLPTVAGLTLSKSGAVVTIQANTGTSLAETGTFTIPVTIDGKTFNKVFSWAKTKAGKNGQDGADGNGVKSIQEQYYLSTSMTSLAGGSWVTTPPTASKGKYIWTRSVITYTDNTTVNTNPVCVSGADGSDGASGVSVTSVDVEYGQSSSATTVPTTWSTDAPAWVNGMYIWSRNKTTYSNGSTSTTNPACITGQKGENGTSAKQVVVNGEQVFKYSNNFTGNPTNTAITLSAILINTSGYQWSYRASGQTTPTNISGATTSTLEVAHNASYWGSNKQLTFRCTSGSVYDEITIVKVTDGSNGTNGSNGSDAYTVVLTNETHSFPSDSSGNIATPISTSTKVLAYKGSTGVTPTIGTLPTVFGLTLTKVDNIVTIQANGGSTLADAGSFDIPITVDGKSFTKTFSWSKVKQGSKGDNGADGANGADAITIVLSNETHSFPCESNGNIPTALTTTCVVTAYKGSASVTPTIGTITNPTGMTITKSGTTITIQANTGTSLADTGTVSIPITVDGKTFTKIFSWSKAKRGANGSNGSDGASAKTVDILASSQVFKSTDGGKTFTPTTITLTPNLQNVTYSNWQYSVNGGSTWATVVSGASGLTISGNVLTISKDSALYTSTVTSIVFRVNTNVSSVYDTVTVIKLYDVTEMSQLDIFNKLTNNGQTQGLYLENGKIYLNGEYMKAKSITADKLHADVLSANSIVSIINGGSTTINGGVITTNSITTDKMAIGDFTNYAQLNSGTANLYGFSKGADEVDGTWFTPKTMARDIRISEYYECNGGESFRIKGEISTTVKGATTSGGTNSEFVGTTISIFAYDGTGKTIHWLHAGGRITNSTGLINSYITLPKATRKFRIYIQTEGYPTFSGTLKVRNVQVTKMTDSGLIVNGSITADMITSGTFKGTNFEAGGSGNNGMFLAKDSSNNVVFSASNNGVYATNVTFVDTVNFDGTFKTSKTSTINPNGLVFSESELSSSYIHDTITRVGNGGFSVSSTMTSGESTTTYSTTITDSAIETTGTIKATGQITSLSSVRGTQFTQSNYGLPIEIGRYIDLHNVGSSADVDVRIESAGTQNRIRVACGDDLSQYSEFGRINNNATFIKNGVGGQFFTMEDEGRLAYGGYTVPHNWRQTFTPFLFSDTGTFSTRSAVGQAVYLGDLVFIQGRIIATRGGHTGALFIGGLPVSNNYNYPAVTFSFFGGLFTGHSATSVDVHGYVQSGAGHIVLNHTDRGRGGWYPLYAEYGVAGEWDVAFSAVYRWR